VQPSVAAKGRYPPVEARGAVHRVEGRGPELRHQPQQPLGVPFRLLRNPLLGCRGSPRGLAAWRRRLTSGAASGRSLSPPRALQHIQHSPSAPYPSSQLLIAQCCSVTRKRTDGSSAVWGEHLHLPAPVTATSSSPCAGPRAPHRPPRPSSQASPQGPTPPLAAPIPRPTSVSRRDTPLNTTAEINGPLRRMERRVCTDAVTRSPDSPPRRCNTSHVHRARSSEAENDSNARSTWST
jgi:hypothetical protein